MSATFKPTRQELRRVQYLATECEIDARTTAQLAEQGKRSWYGMHRPAARAAEAFELSAQVSARSAREGVPA